MKIKVGPCMLSLNKKYNRATQTLDLKECSIENRHIPAICEYLRCNSQITTLDLSFNLLTSINMDMLASVKTLQRLILKINDIDNQGAHFLSKNSNLKLLDLSFNNIGDDGLRLIPKNKNIETLNLRFNKIGSKGASYLAQSQTLKVLNLNDNVIKDEGFKYLAKNKYLQSIELHRNLISDLSLHFLKNNSNLKSLNLSENNISDIGVAQLVQCKSIENLNLSLNALTNDSAKLLSEHGGIKELNVSTPKYIKDFDGTLLNDGACEFFANCKSIKKLNLSYNTNITDLGVQVLSKSETIKFYDLRETSVTEQGAEFFKNNCTFETLLLIDRIEGNCREERDRQQKLLDIKQELIKIGNNNRDRHEITKNLNSLFFVRDYHLNPNREENNIASLPDELITKIASKTVTHLDENEALRFAYKL